MTKSDSREIKGFLPAICMILLGGFFVFSAITKMIPNVNYFDFTIQSQLGIAANLSAILARIFVGVELGLGILLIIQQRGIKGWILKFSLALLVLFTLHLLILFFREGNDVNCGCMGDFIEVSPIASIVKNLVLIGLNIYLLKQFKESRLFKLNHSVHYILLFIPIVFIFLKDPISKKHEILWENILIPGTSWENDANLKEGKSLIAFLSLTCGHCMDAAKELNAMKSEDPDLPVIAIFQAHPEQDKLQEMYEGFEAETGPLQMPSYFAEPKAFVEELVSLGHTGVPVIFWVQDGKVFRSVNNANLNSKEFKSWIK